MLPKNGHDGQTVSCSSRVPGSPPFLTVLPVTPFVEERVPVGLPFDPGFSR